MVNNSEKVYKFTWVEVDYIVIKPSLGYISPGEEKDIEIIFFSPQPVVLRKVISLLKVYPRSNIEPKCRNIHYDFQESLNCSLIAINDDSLTMDLKGATWDNRQTLTQFEKNP